MSNSFRTNYYSVSGQRGVALFVGLMFLLILTLIGLSASNASIMQERMAGNVQEKNLAFQRAEAMLRNIEQRIQQMASGGSGNLGAVDLWAQEGLEVGDCTLSEATQQGGMWGGWGSAPWVTHASDGARPIQQYVILDLGLGGAGYQTSGCTPLMQMSSTPMGQYYMIIARGLGQTDAAEAIVQSIYFSP